MKILSIMQALDETRGTVRVEDTFATNIDDLWAACTQPERLARWVADVSGGLHVGGEFRARFTSGWEGTGSVEVCDPPRRLSVLTTQDEEDAEHVLEATLTAVGDTTVLVIEERDLPLKDLPAYAAGWQAHVEDLAAHVTGRDRGDLAVRWNALISTYRRLAPS